MTYQSEVLADSPVLYWKFDEPAGTANVADSSGNGWAGLVQGSQTDASGTVPLVAGSASSATCSDANGVGFIASNAGGMASPGQFTVELWFKTVATVATGDTLAARYQATGTATDWWIFFSSGKVNARNVSAGNTQALSAVALNDGAVHHLVMVQRATTLDLWVDGALSQSVASTATADVASPTKLLTAGGAYGASANAANCAIDEFAFYAGALTPARIQAHYTAGTSTAPTPATVQWWDGSAAYAAALDGWHDGVTVQAGTVKGWWDGATVQPLT